MSDIAIAVLAVAAVVLVAVIFLRRQIKSLLFKAGVEGVQATFETHGTSNTAPGVRITGNKMEGKRHRIDVERSDVELADNTLRGEDHGIRAAEDPSLGGKRP